MFGFGSKKKRTKLLHAAPVTHAPSQKELAALAYECPECKKKTLTLVPLEGRSINDLKSDLEVKCTECGKDIIVENKK